MSETTESNKPKIGLVPMDKVVVVDRKHPLADKFWTPRNDYKPDAAMTASIKAAGRPEYPALVWPWKDADGNVQLIVIDGNQRVNASRAAGITQMPVEVRADLSEQQASALATRTNSQRKDNSFATNAILATRMVNPDESGKPQGLSYEQAAAEFGKTHTWVRNLVKAWRVFPTKIKNAIESGKLPFTAAIALLKQEYIDDQAKMLEAFDKIMADEDGAITNTSGKVGRGKVDKVKNPNKLSANVWRLIAKSSACPEEYANLIQVVIGDKSLEWGREQGLDFLVEPSKDEQASVKGKGKGTKGKGTKGKGKKVAEAPSASGMHITNVDLDDLNFSEFE